MKNLGHLRAHVPIRLFALLILNFAIIDTTRAQETGGDTLALQEEAAMRAAVESVAPSVVQIRTIGGLDSVEGTPLASGPTTGLVISADGYILSSAFNFVQKPSSILVALHTGQQLPAELVATDHSRMLVLLKINGARDLTVPSLAPLGEIRVGAWAVAVGRTFRVDRPNLAIGVVSAVNRMHGKAIQTDASISTANYGGPLVDVRGRVMGVLVPMAPQATSEVAGVEWYDSGIGFAVPPASIAGAIDRMKKGEDQHPGLLGISMAGRRPLTTPAELAAVRPDSPAGRAGLKKGDRVIEVNGGAIKSQAEVRLALGARYAGEDVKVVVLRGEERLEKTIQLVAKMPPFRHAFLGLLPMRPTETAAVGDETDGDAGDDDGKAPGDGQPKDELAAGDGVVVRAVYPGSPAADARLQPRDRLIKINNVSVPSVNRAFAELNNVVPGDAVALTLLRGEQEIEARITAARMPSIVPSELPSAYEEPADGTAATANGETHDIKLPAMPQNAKVYVPAAHASGRPHGLLLWLHAPGDADPTALLKQWQPICDRDGLILVVPTAQDKNQWDRTELEYLGRLMLRLVRQYRPDPRRVIVYGQGGSGGLAYLAALPNRNVFSGVATSAAPLPRQASVPDGEPAQRFAVYAALPTEAAQTNEYQHGLKKLADAGYPVSTATISDPAGKLSPKECEDLAHWIDTLDRF
jgi:serine protease Do